MSPTRRDILKQAGALAGLIGAAGVSGVMAAENAPQAPTSGATTLTSVISTGDPYPPRLGTMAGIVLAGYAHWTEAERSHFLTEFERTFPDMTASIIGWIQRPA